jgi:flagellin
MSTIGTNPSALNAAFSNAVSLNDVHKIVRRMASSSKLANPEDDAAGVAVSSKLDAAIQRYGAATEGVQNLTSFAQTSDSYLSVAQSEITRLGELAIRANDGTLSEADRANVNAEFVKVRDALNTQVANASFNGTKVFDTSQTIGAVVTEDGSVTYNLTLANAASDISGIANIDITTPEKAMAAIGKVDTALQNIASSRAKVNSDVASLNQYSLNLQSGKINTEAANSRIRDTDYAAESTNLARASILNQASSAMLAQANLQPKSVLSLLG